MPDVMSVLAKNTLTNLIETCVVRCRLEEFGIGKPDFRPRQSLNAFPPEDKIYLFDYVDDISQT